MLVSVGQFTLTDLNDGINARLSNESQSIPTAADGSGGDFSGCVTTMSVYIGPNDDSANWTFSAVATSGLTGQLVGRTYQVTALAADAGYVDITASRAGFSSLTSRFTVSKAKQGQAGSQIYLVPSTQGFFYKDGVANPSSQTISFTLVRNGVTGTAVFTTSNGKTLRTDNELSLANYMFGTPGVLGLGDVAYFDIADFAPEKSVSVTVAVGSQTSTLTILRLDSSTAEAGATRNVTRGAWSSAGVLYVVGDIVTYSGSSYACILSHTSSGASAPPTTIELSNAYWVLQSAKGDVGSPGAPGASGADGYAYNMSVSAAAIQKSTAGALTPSTISLLGYRSIGASVAIYAGRFVVATSTNGTTFTDQYTSASDQSSYTYTVPAGVVAIRTRMYLAGGTTTLVDEEVVPVVADGSNALTVTLSNEGVTVPADANGNVSSYTGTGTDIYVFEGTTAFAYVSSITANNQFSVSVSATGITAGSITASGSGVARAIVANQSAMTADTASITYTITARKSDGTTVTLTKQQSFSKAKSGSGAVSCILTNESDTVQASSAGVVSSYVGTGTDIYVYEGNTALTYAASITANNQFSIAVAASGITAGSITASGSGTARAIVGDHSNMTANTATVTYTITARKSDGTNVTIVKQQGLTKALAGADGTSATAQFVRLTADKQTFTYTDTVANPTTQSDITFTLNRSNVGAGAATFSTSPAVTLGGTGDTRTLSLANFGGNREVVVTASVTFNSVTYTDKITVVRLDASTAAAGATVGATIGVNLGGQITAGNSSGLIASNAVFASQIDTRGLSIKDAAGNVILAAGTALPVAYAPSETINSNITLDGNGSIQGIGAGAGTQVSNATLAYGINLLYNSDFSNGFDSWGITGGYNLAQNEGGINLSTDWYLAPYSGAGTNVLWSRQIGSANNSSFYYEYSGKPVPVIGGARYAFSAYTGAHRCQVAVFAYIHDSAGNVIGNTTLDYNSAEAFGGKTLSGYKRLVSVGTMPSNAAYIKVMLRKYDTFSGNSDSYMFVARVQAEQIASDASSAGPWSPGGYTDETAVRSVNRITSSNVSTYIANAAIQNAQIGNIIQSNNFASGSAGWQIDKSGNMEINSATFRGTIDVKNAASGARLEIKNNVIKVFDANGTLRVRIGDLTA